MKVGRLFDIIQLNELFLGLMPNKLILLESKLIQFWLEIVWKVFGRTSSLSYYQTAANRHSLVAFPARSIGGNRIRSMH